MTPRAHEPYSTYWICTGITLAIITIVFHAAMKMGGVL